MATEATWEPHEKHGRLTKHSDLLDMVFAFPKQRKEPLTDTQRVRDAVARFDQVIDVSRQLFVVLIVTAASLLADRSVVVPGTPIQFSNGFGARRWTRRSECLP